MPQKTGKVRSHGKRRVACDDHEHVERNLMQSKLLGKNYTMRIRMERFKSELAKVNAFLVRMGTPGKSDHCHASSKNAEGARSHGKEFRGTWVAGFECGGTVLQHVIDYTVNFKRHLTYVNCAAMRPCGMDINGKFFPNA